MRNFKRIIPITLSVLLLSFMIGPGVSMAYETGVDLKTADSFAVLAGSTITNSGPTFIEGDVGLYDGTEFTGEDQAVIDGEVHIGDDVAIQAKEDLTAAYIDAEGRPAETTDSELGGKTFKPGVYSSETSLQITGNLILDGEDNPDSVFIFQAGSTLTTATDSKIELINGATCENVFWVVGSSATLGTNSEFKGTILALTSISANNGAEIQGRLLARNGAVTLQNNTISACTSATTNSLTVTKVVVGDIDGLTLPTFEITVTGPEGFSETRNFDNNESYTWDDLESGEYNITENQELLGSEWAVAGEGAVQVSADGQYSATITNTYTESGDDTLTGSLIVTKVVTGDTDDLMLPTFEITVTGPGGFSETRDFDNNESYTWDELEPGEYTVTESRDGLSSEWIVSGEGAVQVSADGQYSATITNAYTASIDDTPIDDTPVDDTPVDDTHGSLTVETIVTGDTDDIMIPTFEITVIGPDGFSESRSFDGNESYTWENLITGEYTITVDSDDLSNEWTISGEGVVQVDANHTEIVMITTHFEAIDTIESIPQTGQTSSYIMALFLGLTATIFAGVGLVYANKRKTV